MKKLLFLFSFVLSAMIVSAQDVIVKTDGSTILAKVLNVTSSEIQYKKFSNPDGPTYTLSVSELISINYENGEKDTFSISKTTTENRNEIYTPTKITAETASKYSNDKQLEKLYYSINYDSNKKKAKIWKYVGIVGGGTAIITGMALYFTSKESNSWTDWDGTQRKGDEWINYGKRNAGYFTAGGGALLCATGLILSNHYSKLAKNSVYTSSIYGQDFNFNNGSKLNVGIDAINGYNFNEKALGIGIRYNF